MKIGVFDSGIGGLTVLKKLLEKYPNNEYVYYGDTKNIPYGDKSIEELKILSSNIIDFLIKKEVDIIIIACGTISSNLSLYLKTKYNIKIIDIISPVIDYLNNNSYKKIGVIATQATINSKIFSNNIKKDVKEILCPKFVPLIEDNNLDELNKYIDIYVSYLKDREEYLGNEKKLLDMAECIDDITNEGINKLDLYFSKLDQKIINNIKGILKNKINSINLVE